MASFAPSDITEGDRLAVPALIRVDLRAGADRQFDAPLGRLVHGAFFQILAQYDADEATAIHDALYPPLAISPLMRASTGAALEESDGPPAVVNGEMVWLTLGVLTPTALEIIGEMLWGRWRDGAPFPIGHVPFRIERIGLATPNGMLAAPRGYAELLATSLPANEVILRFTSPVLLRRAGSYRRTPEPRPVLASHLRRWNAHAPTPLDRLNADTLEQHVSIADTAITMRTVGLYGEHAVGLLGLARYRVEGDVETRRQVAALARLAPWCGTGSRTLYGMGQTECLALIENGTFYNAGGGEERRRPVETPVVRPGPVLDGADA